MSYSFQGGVGKLTAATQALQEAGRFLIERLEAR
jgi:hypothetical protein